MNSVVENPEYDSDKEAPRKDKNRNRVVAQGSPVRWFEVSYRNEAQRGDNSTNYLRGRYMSIINQLQRRIAETTNRGHLEDQGFMFLIVSVWHQVQKIDDVRDNSDEMAKCIARATK